jgi:hypothetical protein
LKKKRKVAKYLGINRETVAKYWDQPISDLIENKNSPEWASKINWTYVQSEIERGVSAKCQRGPKNFNLKYFTSKKFYRLRYFTKFKLVKQAS